MNTSRAGLVDQAAMLAALRDGRIMAALDVYEREPIPPNDPIRDAPNTVLTPHLGYGSVDTFRLHPAWPATQSFRVETCASACR